MSAGAFELSKYERNGQVSIHSIRIQPETAALVIGAATNGPPAGDEDSDFSAKVSRGNTEYGLLPRKVTVRFTGTLPTGYKADQTISLPILTEAMWTGISRGNTGTYLGEAVQVVSKSNEDVR